MTTQRYLEQIDFLNRRIQNKLSEIYRLKLMASSVSVASDKEYVQGNGDKDRLGNAVAKIVDMERETDRLVDEYISKRCTIINQIDALDNADYYDVLSKRYINNDAFDAIANKTHWSVRKVYKLHGEALKAFEKRYGNTYLS